MTYPDEDEYLRIYRSGQFPKLVSNLESILDQPVSDECQVSIGVRTPRKNWSNHPLFRRARARGWRVSKNHFFDDWSGRTLQLMDEQGLRTRPNRSKWLPCAMTFSGPHFLSDGRATACGCRDLDGTSELALDSNELLDDLSRVYDTGSVSVIRERFRQGDPPDICRSCRHYNPHYAGESVKLKLHQLSGDCLAGIRSLLTP